MARGRYSQCFCPQGEGSGPHREPGHRGRDGLVSERSHRVPGDWGLGLGAQRGSLHVDRPPGLSCQVDGA